MLGDLPAHIVHALPCLYMQTEHLKQVKTSSASTTFVYIM